MGEPGDHGISLIGVASVSELVDLGKLVGKLMDFVGGRGKRVELVDLVDGRGKRVEVVDLVDGGKRMGKLGDPVDRAA